MSQDPDVLMEVSNLHVSFKSGHGEMIAVDDVSFKVRSGCTVAIVGESGSGKTVSSLAVLGLLQKGSPSNVSGKIELSPEFGDGTAERTSPGSKLLVSLRGVRIAMIFQEPMTALNPVMPCGVQVAECLRYHRGMSAKEAREEVIRLFDEVAIPDPENAYGKYPHQMSGGQRQRVMIAMAISCEPKILIADEPTTALDVSVQRAVLELLKSLQKRYGLGIVFITHDLGIVADIADEVVVMRKGRIVEHGSTLQVLGKPEHPYTRGLLAARPSPDKKGRQLSADSDTGLSPDHVTLGSITGTEILVVSDLVKEYRTARVLGMNGSGGYRAINNLSFSIYKGETLGLVGESGCGKTTLSRVILGLIPATSGDVHYKGSNILHASKSEWRKIRKQIQIVFQDPYSSLNGTMTIRRILTEPLVYHRVRHTQASLNARVVELMERVGLSESHLDRYPHEFSGGQRQRIVIARALAVEPDLLVCDEPVSALDVSVQAQVLNLLNELKRDLGLTYLFITHDLNVAYYMSDRIMVMNKGKLEEIGSADEVFYNAQSIYTKNLFASIPGRRHS